MSQALCDRYSKLLSDCYMTSVFVVGSNVLGLPPESAKKDPLHLQIGLNTSIPIPDLAVTSWGITGTLLFDRRGHYVQIPWSAVIAFCDYVHDSGDRSKWYWVTAWDRQAPAEPADVPNKVAVKSAGNVVKVDFKARRRA